jgi:SPP1 gp7 family putative phage head morphogenesis protein
VNRLQVHAADRAGRVRALRPAVPSRALELWYRTELLRLVRRLRNETERSLKPLLMQIGAMDGGLVGDAGPVDVSKKIAALAKRFGGLRETANKLADLAARRAAYHTDQQLAAEIKKSVRIDITPVLKRKSIERVMKKATKDNIDLITSIPEQYFGKVREALVENFSSGQRWETLVDKLVHVGDVTESRAKVIARDQTSKMNSSFNQTRQESLGIEEYEWQTSGDERVRDTHAANNGKTFRWDNPPSETGHPGEDILCRCTAIPKLNLDKMEKELGIYDE